jgi:Rrf2 family protein
MRVSKHEEFGLRLVIQLARNGGRLNIRELSENEGLPETTVAKVVARLRQAGVVAAERGRNGGYSLQHPADALTLAQVVAAFDDRLFDSDFCARMNAGSSCANDNDCSIRPVWRRLSHLIGNFLAGVTVDDLVRGSLPAPDSDPAHRELPVVSPGGL